MGLLQEVIMPRDWRLWLLCSHRRRVAARSQQALRGEPITGKQRVPRLPMACADVRNIRGDAGLLAQLLLDVQADALVDELIGDCLGGIDFARFV